MCDEIVSPQYSYRGSSLIWEETTLRGASTIKITRSISRTYLRHRVSTTSLKNYPVFVEVLRSEAGIRPALVSSWKRYSCGRTSVTTGVRLFLIYIGFRVTNELSKSSNPRANAINVYIIESLTSRVQPQEPSSALYQSKMTMASRDTL